MKTNVQDTSKESFKDVKNHNSTTRCIQVYEVIKRLGSCPNSVIAKELNLFPHEITGRTYDLRNMFKVVGFDKKDYCPIQFSRDGTKRLVNFWKVVKDWDREKYKNSIIFLDVVNRCYECGCVACGCEVQK